MRTAPHVTVNVVRAASPAGTETISGFVPLTVQLSATPESWTLCGPATRPANVTLPFVAIACARRPPPETAHPSGPSAGPVVLVTTMRLPTQGATSPPARRLAAARQDEP